MKRRTFALLLALAACSSQPAPVAEQTATSCPVSLAEVQAINKENHWRSVALDAASLARAKLVLAEYDEDRTISTADGAFFVWMMDGTVGLGFVQHGCVMAMLAPFSRSEIADIMGAES